MSHRPPWQCSTCRYQLGEIVCGGLRLWVQQPLIGPDATAVICPRCSETNVWRYKAETPVR